MIKFDTGEEGDVSKDITIIVGTRHLSTPTSVYLPQYNMSYPCIIDLSAEGFNKFGLFNSKTNALLPVTRDLDDDPLAYVDQHDDTYINAEGGKRIWIMERALLLTPLQAPFDKDVTIDDYSHIDKYFKLPAVMFHELSHTILTGTQEARREFLDLHE